MLTKLSPPHETLWTRPGLSRQRHTSPDSRGGYTVTPHPTSTTRRSELRTDWRVSPLTRAEALAGRPAFPRPPAGRAVRPRAGCVVFVLILGCTGADCAMGLPLFLRCAGERVDTRGSRDRTRTFNLPTCWNTLCDAWRQSSIVPLNWENILEQPSFGKRHRALLIAISVG